VPDEPAEWQIVASARARRDLRALPEKAATAVFEFIDGPLRSNPYRLGRKLRGPLVGFYSARRGEYRVIYRLKPDEKTLEISHIMHRRDAYRTR
jgi:mRNA interferase RelE/StbE